MTRWTDTSHPPRLHAGNAGHAGRLTTPGVPVMSHVTVAVLTMIPLGVLCAWMYTQPDRWLDGAVTAAVLLAAAIVLPRQPHLVVHLFIVAFMANREVRRLLDYQALEFSSTPITSLLPPLLAMMMGLAGLETWREVPRAVRTPLIMILAALMYGLMIGIRNGFGAIYGFVSWSTPLGLFLFMFYLKPTLAQVRSWLITLIVVATLAAAYGWVQFTLLPPWDKFWVVQSGMSSLGKPEALSVRFFGPMSNPGGLANLCLLAVVPMVVYPKWRAFFGPLGVAMVVFLVVSILMTRARTTWLVLVAAVGLYALLGRASDQVRIVMASVVLVGVVAAALPMLPGGNTATTRLSTFTDLSSDGSVNGRLKFTRLMTQQIMVKPFGWGLGSSGLNARVGSKVSVTAFDNGLLQFPYTFGWMGAALFITALVRLWIALRKAPELPGEFGAIQRLAQCLVLAFMLALVTSNWFNDDAAAFIWLLLGVSLTWRFFPPRDLPLVQPEPAGLYVLPSEAQGTSHR